MQTLVVFDSTFGNTERIAETIARALRPRSTVRLLPLAERFPEDLAQIDLLIVGGSTQRHGISARMRQFTDGLAARSGMGMMAAAFDTRYRMPAVLSGSAAKTIARRLHQLGIPLAARPQSFFVSHGQPPALETGEAERAAEWAKKLAIHCVVSKWCAA